MFVFVGTLEKDVEKKLKKIECSDLNILKKSLEASLVLGDALSANAGFRCDLHIQERSRRNSILQGNKASLVLSPALLSQGLQH